MNKLFNRFIQIIIVVLITINITLYNISDNIDNEIKSASSKVYDIENIINTAKNVDINKLISICNNKQKDISINKGNSYKIDVAEQIYIDGTIEDDYDINSQFNIECKIILDTESIFIYTNKYGDKKYIAISNISNNVCELNNIEDIAINYYKMDKQFIEYIVDNLNKALLGYECNFNDNIKEKIKDIQTIYNINKYNIKYYKLGRSELSIDYFDKAVVQIVSNNNDYINIIFDIDNNKNINNVSVV